MTFETNLEFDNSKFHLGFIELENLCHYPYRVKVRISRQDTRVYAIGQKEPCQFVRGMSSIMAKFYFAKAMVPFLRDYNLIEPFRYSIFEMPKGSGRTPETVRLDGVHIVNVYQEIDTSLPLFQEVSIIETVVRELRNIRGELPISLTAPGALGLELLRLRKDK